MVGWWWPAVTHALICFVFVFRERTRPLSATSCCTKAFWDFLVSLGLLVASGGLLLATRRQVGWNDDWDELIPSDKSCNCSPSRFLWKRTTAIYFLSWANLSALLVCWSKTTYFITASVFVRLNRSKISCVDQLFCCNCNKQKCWLLLICTRGTRCVFMYWAINAPWVVLFDWLSRLGGSA